MSSPVHLYTASQFHVDAARRHHSRGELDEMIQHLKTISLDVAMFLRVLEAEKAALATSSPKLKRKPRGPRVVRKKK
jgi:hypothetical protein